jgi:hypothetical protein
MLHSIKSCIRILRSMPNLCPKDLRTGKKVQRGWRDESDRVIEFDRRWSEASLA